MNIEKAETYKALQKQFTSIEKIRSVTPFDNGEPMVSLKKENVPIAPYNKTLALATGDDLYVRKGLVEKLKLAQAFLKASLGQNYELQVTYAYRTARIQTDKFIKILAREISKAPEETNKEWINNTHRYIAAPDIAGHPTGGAVDVWIIDGNGVPLDMGTPTHTLTEDSYVFSPYIPEPAKENRMHLRNIMTESGFAPFDGEWWHFSFGDREWAAVAGENKALYGQIDFDYKTGICKPLPVIEDRELIKRALNLAQ